MVDFVDIEIYDEIIDTIQELDTADLFEIKLAKILKEFISIELNNLNSKILKIYKKFIEKSESTPGFKIENINFDKIPLNSNQKRIIDRKDRLLKIHADLEKFISGDLLEEDFSRHREEFLGIKETKLGVSDGKQTIFKDELNRDQIEISKQLPLVTTEKVLNALSEEWHTIKHLIFKLKIKDMMDTRYLHLKLKELERKGIVLVESKKGKRQWKLKR